ncbi:alpha/beta hydrolase [Roseobacter weihaiensis]|uniref:alpha/beta hydrolase n=1 Tax=Roseobacter weihaiensis TaxID=2763262 RepID=UPI001D0A3E82|nr:alpha/beta hydrolase [Roseobacter sp. H9]
MCVLSSSEASTNVTYDVRYRPGAGLTGLAAWLALPPYIDPTLPPVVAVHGIRRGAELQARLFAKRAAASGRPVIAPLFDAERWGGYQQAALRGRADLALIDLMASLAREGLIGANTLDLFGFSGGAQFVHRFAMLHPTRVAKLSIASPGWYTFPDNAPYPYGLSPPANRDANWARRLPANIGQFLALPMNVCIGEQDCVADKNTRSGDAIDAQQGLHRHARAHRWSAAIRAAATALGIRPRVALHVLKNCGHDFEACVHKGELDKIVIPRPQRTTCRGTCNLQQQQACRLAKSFELPHALETPQ